MSRSDAAPLLQLPSVTLCAVTSVNVAATVAAMRACQDQVAFGDAILLSDVDTKLPATIRRIPIARLRSSADYSRFLLRELVDHVRTDHVLVVQWDGFVLDAARWDPAFLDFDYIGAPWPQFDDDYVVGNGGFSLRSARLLDACADERFQVAHPEDIAIGRHNRRFLEERGCRFADRDLAERFSYERGASRSATFGFHGVFNLISAVGPERFWELYQLLDHRETVWHDLSLLLRQQALGQRRWRRRLRMVADLISAELAGR